MFETHETAKVEVPGIFTEPGEHLWQSVYTRLNVQWLHVVAVSKPEAQEYSLVRNLFLSQIEDLSRVSEDKNWDVVEVSLVSPAHLNGSRSWEMDLVFEIQRARDPSLEHDQDAYVFLLKDGKRLTVSYTCDASELVDHETIYSSTHNC